MNTVFTYDVIGTHTPSDRRIGYTVTVNCGTVELTKFVFLKDELNRETNLTISDEETAVTAALTILGARLKKALSL